MALYEGTYIGVFGLLLIAVAALLVQLNKSGKSQPQVTEEFAKGRRMFLVAYFVMVAADWLQGPFVYKLYSFYGLSKEEIGMLFVAGYLSSAVFGTVVSGLADQLGRKRVCCIYGVIYFLSCLTKHASSFYVLFLGRLLAGIAASILASGFETWITHEHRRNGYPDDWLTHTFSLMSFGNGLVAIGAGLSADFGAAHGGYVAPFDMAAVLLAVGTMVVWRTWRENFGDSSAARGSNFAVGWVIVASNAKVWLLGLVQACFEGAIFVFVFSWTPILEASATSHADLPHGLVFACFMVSMMIGSTSFKLLLNTKPEAAVPERLLPNVVLAAAGALFVPVVTGAHLPQLLALCIFESCVGVYYPCIGSLRARIIPNEVRATIMSLFRVPLNLIVVVALLNVSSLGATMISVVTVLLALASYAGLRVLERLLHGNVATAMGESTEDGPTKGSVEDNPTTEA